MTLSYLLDELAAQCVGKSLSIVTAESCTGGGVAYAITSMPGSSQWFDRGFITYSNLAKIEMLGVDEEVIKQRGAVSEVVARQMAEGALKASKANLSLSITGIAGPQGGSKEKPIGTCYFAWASPFFETCSKKKIMAKDRHQIRTLAIAYALEQLLWLIKTNW